jgi:hypothetical protein
LPVASFCIFFLCLGVIVRFRLFLFCPSYWYDEAYLLLNVYRRSWGELLGAIDYQVVIPPGFLWLLRSVYLLLGGAEWAMRLPSLVAGLAALVLMVPLAQRALGRSGWVWSVCLCAVSPHAVMHACEVRAYSDDLLLTEIILLGALIIVRPAGPASALWGYVILCGAALAGPWLSFPSAFVLAAAGLALLLHHWREPHRACWRGWLLFCGLTLLSGATMWYFSARHLYYPGLHHHWAEGWNGFPDTSTWPSSLAWVWNCAVGVHQYAAADMGVPLLLLGVVGVVAFVRRCPTVVMLLLGPALAGGAAAFAGRYPLGDRTAFYLAPCLWLLAGSGIAFLVERCRPRFGWFGMAVLTLPLLPGTIRLTGELVQPAPRTAFREAFRLVDQNWRDHDSLWVSHAEVHAVYGTPPVTAMSAGTPPAEVARQARRGRLWMVYTPQVPGLSTFPETFDAVRAAVGEPVLHRAFLGLEVALYAPVRRDMRPTQKQ